MSATTTAATRLATPSRRPDARARRAAAPSVPSRASLRLTVLGEPSCSYRGRPLHALRHRPLVAAFLASMALGDERTPEDLARLLYGSDDRSLVDGLVADTERLLGHAWVDRTSDVPGLGRDVRIDLVDLIDDFRRGRYGSVAAAPEGAFLDSPGLPSHEAFVAWRTRVRERVRWLRAEAQNREHLRRVMAALGDAVLVRASDGQLLPSNVGNDHGVDIDLDDEAFNRRLDEQCATVDCNHPSTAIIENHGRRLRLSIVRVSGWTRHDEAHLIGVRRLGPPWPSMKALEAAGLTRREAKVAILLAEGYVNDEIARALFISPFTAKRHTENILRKLGLRSRAAVAAHLLRLCGPRKQAAERM